mmetsp:Transcript_24079/g.27488  ORF Transcript_24079/g.27488 Transcript_24079/m.27488 type:complete len:505 (+) Transcript_24079:149-1663(+)
MSVMVMSNEQKMSKQEYISISNETISTSRKDNHHVVDETTSLRNGDSFTTSLRNGDSLSSVDRNSIRSRISHRPKWLKRTIARLKHETNATYKDYDTYSVGSKAAKYNNIDYEDKESVTSTPLTIHVQSTTATDSTSWKVQTIEQDSGLVTTIAIHLFFGLHGFIVYVIIDCFIFGNVSKRLLLLFLVLSCLAQPRGKDKSILAMIAKLSILAIFALSIYFQSITITIMSGSIILPLEVMESYGQKFGDWGAQHAQKYFGLKTTLEAEAEISEISKRGDACIFACEPHDVFGFGCIATHAKMQRLPPGRVLDTMQCLVSSAILNTPIARQMFSWLKCAPVEKSYFREKLQRKESFIFVPGGLQEVFLMDPSRPQELALYLKQRKGFIKMALETGTPVCPVFCFGLNGCYAYYLQRGPIITKVSRLIGFLPLLFFGRWSIPCGTPKPQKLHVVFGKPIEFPCKGKNIKEDDLNYYHELFLRELEDLFERHKVNEDGYRERKLKIV